MKLKQYKNYAVIVAIAITGSIYVLWALPSKAMELDDPYTAGLNERNIARIEEALKNNVPLTAEAIRKYLSLDQLITQHSKIAEFSTYQTEDEKASLKSDEAALRKIGLLFQDYLKKGGQKPLLLRQDEWEYFKKTVYPYEFLDNIGKSWGANPTRKERDKRLDAAPDLNNVLQKMQEKNRNRYGP